MFIGKKEKSHSKHSENLGHNIFALLLLCKYSNKIVTINRYLKLSFHVEIHSFDDCRAKVLEQEPDCLDYSLFQSYNDSTLFCLTEAWATKGAHNAHMQLAHTKNHIFETRGIRALVANEMEVRASFSSSPYP
jgi:quinol monooxygenase YgiN